MRDWISRMALNGQKERLARASKEYAAQLERERIAQRDEIGALNYFREHALYPVPDDCAQILDRYMLGLVLNPLPGDERFAGMLSIPYLTPNGVRAIKYRRLAGSGSKYSQANGQKPRLYNIAAYFKADEVIGVCEGEIDAIAATEWVGVPTLGIPGAEVWHSMRDVWQPIFNDFRLVCVFEDGDQPGRQMAREIAEDLGWRARVIPCGDGMDVASTVAIGEADSLRRRCELARDDE